MRRGWRVGGGVTKMLLQETEGAGVSEAAAGMTKKHKNLEAQETGMSGSESTWTSDSTNENGHGVFSIQDKKKKVIPTKIQLPGPGKF